MPNSQTSQNPQSHFNLDNLMNVLGDPFKSTLLCTAVWWMSYLQNKTVSGMHRGSRQRRWGSPSHHPSGLFYKISSTKCHMSALLQPLVHRIRHHDTDRINKRNTALGQKNVEGTTVFDYILSYCPAPSVTSWNICSVEEKKILLWGMSVDQIYLFQLGVSPLKLYRGENWFF